MELLKLLKLLKTFETIKTVETVKTFETTKNRFIDIENVRNEKVTEIHKTQSTVPWSTSETGSLPGFSRSPEHGSFVKLREIDSLASKT